MKIILTHENADFDAVAGLLAAARLHPDYIPVLPQRLNQNVVRFLALYGSAFPFVYQSDLTARAISHVLLVDTQRMASIKHIRKDAHVMIIDHHPASGEAIPHQSFSYEPVGAVTTLMVEQIRQKGIAINSLEATLLMLGIYEDTGTLTYGTTTARDIKAASWLLEHQAVLDTVRRFLSPSLSDEQQNLLELLLSHMETRDIQGYSVSLSAVTVSEYIPEVSSVAHRLRDLLSSAALFVIVDMPSSKLLVARSTVDAIHVGDVARALGGGGHGRAAAATIRDLSLEEIIASVWQELESSVLPMTRVADLMSFGVQTVEVGQPLSAVIRRLRQIGHEGYPVVEAGRVVGLLTRRDLDRADEHQMRDLLVRDVMSAGNVTLMAKESVFELEKVMLETGWGQIPVVDEAGKLIGIVTRTDLLKYWSTLHPTLHYSERSLTSQQFENILGKHAAAFIQIVAEIAQKSAVSVYLVGGVVRDLLLGRANFDIDFVVEGNAIEFAEGIQRQRGGQLTAYKPFGTAKWKPSNESSLDHIDFASARYEFYEHPTALPTVYDSSIKLDLQRRDFTINTLAVRVSPVSMFGRIVDYYGGQRDLEARLVRVLHSLSFIDDPTRILRAFRFERRLGFKIEQHTLELIKTALPMLARITGERLRNELSLLLNENQPEQGLVNLQDEGVLVAIHPAFRINNIARDAFQNVRTIQPSGTALPTPLTDLYWHILFSQLEMTKLQSVCDRLMFGRKMTESLLKASELVHQVGALSQSGIRPSVIVSYLKNVPELALLALWYVSDNLQVRENLTNYWTTWRHKQPIATGETLKQMGLKAGPCYRLILTRVREAWLDGFVQNEMEEKELLNRLIHDERICDDHT
ncbi:MAG: CBS domain-containing protein [Anaerolineaceae bacterium]|nr:CBS domain-containing protein [Anaerolineaceae bacterium]